MNGCSQRIIVSLWVGLFMFGCSTQPAVKKTEQADKQSSQLTQSKSRFKPVVITKKQEQEAGWVKQGLNAFKNNQYDQSKSILTDVQKKYPKNPVAAYYLGLIALQKENNKEAIKQWRKYLELDPIEAEKNQVTNRLTLLENEEIDNEVQSILDSEASISKEPPAPNTVAVFTFSNKGDSRYSVFAKGITALVITDLSKVPGLKVLERQKIQKLVGELKLSTSGLVDDKTKVRAGKMMKAEKLMFGDFEVKK